MSSRLVLVLGDLFIPDRAIDIPQKFKKLLTPGKIGQILCLGNLTSPSVYHFLRSLAPDLQLVKGDFDIPLTTTAPSPDPSQPRSSADASFPIPTALSKIVTHGSLRIGFTHADNIIPPGDPDALLIAARQMDVDVLCWGGTCKFEAYEMEGKFFVNPGSATGAVSWNDETLGDEEEDGNTPSFVLMDVQGDVLVLYVYQLKKNAEGNESVGVEKVSFRKYP
ncbi:Vacuolar protein sorting-associated protein 29 [Fulvia fulva]|uniref:Vacuolar protein sorting-associated protein 29 n=1 Tax=Passalora fulva TaxID=5499 RepID=A0A9Q8PLD6_PASFU|nr:Vacuolar protein sorting-associated protein 29 [Fulvia fulva]KAK4610053.1 Vacuolar protein sorting-associated protein 29 [Fulvia fulva]KAK4610794.1 Vacuolar protein sorting-associated protein 29 [Fulvia fulva]UJO24666.1 Vacuolar protein sorting-associated protein 29 [Fulvia fulva]WPV22140.1 Vacuolar protein sorting-associated protein 29 [Fulvia fulva]WPV37261.1 Vacuolar protein sorting-associated protein 29 [Fulvia fulva]